MSPVSPLPVIPCLLLALLTISVVSKFLKTPLQTGRFQSIDGLRGYLAFFVFLHHSAIWYYFANTGRWAPPPSLLYNHFGPVSVSLFFMITAFLFFSKLLATKGEYLDWLKLYISRFLRIMPLYFFVLLLLFVVVGILTNWTLREPASNVFIQCAAWLAFAATDINGVRETQLLVAGVFWSLSFEWLFYFSLPFWGRLLFNIKASFTTILLAAALLLLFTMVVFTFYGTEPLAKMSPFLGGMAAAFLAPHPRLQQAARSIYASFLIIGLLLFVFTFYSSIYSPIPILCLSIVFIAIACGNTLFGLLTAKASCLLGQVTYSIYLIHGILLFSLFSFVPAYSGIARQSPLAHWCMIAGTGVLLTVISAFTYQYIELPFMHKTNTLHQTARHYLKDKRLNPSRIH